MSKIRNKKLFFAMAVAVVFSLLSFNVYAGFPEKPIKILVGRGAGGSTDVVTRTFAQFFGKHLGVPVVVNNMKGAGGRIMLKHMNAQPADGYMLATITVPSYINVQLLRKPSYDLNQFSYIQCISGGDSNGLIVPYDSKIKSFADLIATAKKGPVTIGATSPGSNSWLLSVLLAKHAADFKFNYVPFTSGKKASMAIVGGHVTVGISSTINFPDLVKAKKIRVLGVASKERLSYLPNAPTFTELEYPGIVTEAQLLIAAPPGLPGDVEAILEAAAAKAVDDPEYFKLAEKQGFSVLKLSAQDAEKSFKDHYKAVNELLKSVGEIK